MFLFCYTSKDIKTAALLTPKNFDLVSEPLKIPPVEMKPLKHKDKYEIDEAVKFPLIENLKSI